jgi:hypothetical protein
MSLPFVSLLSIFSFTITISYAVPWACRQTVVDNDLRITFDLCDFQLTNRSGVDYWSIVDNRDIDESNYTYFFNVANDATSVPWDNAECYDQKLRNQFGGMLPGYCVSINESGGGCTEFENITTSPVAAYQMYRGNNRENRPCWRLHDGVTEPVWAVLDAADPARGVSITYLNGDYAPGCNDNRDFEIRFQCSDNIENIPDKEEEISETSPCHYEFTMQTTHGCPIECPIFNDKICSGHGVCDYDFTNHYPKCYCFYGWYGRDCSANDEDIGIIYNDDEEAFVGSLVIIILLMVVVLAIIAYLFMRYSKLGHGFIDAKQNRKRKHRQRVADDEYAEE